MILSFCAFRFSIFYQMLLLLPAALAFEVLPPSVRRPLIPTRTTAAVPFHGMMIRTQVEDNTEENNSPIEEDPLPAEPSFSSSLGRRQHWLDLRGTAIRPEEALVFLEEFLLNDDDDTTTDENSKITSMKDMIDCILLPEDNLSHMSKNITSSVELLVVKNGSNLVCEAPSGVVKGSLVQNGSSKKTGMMINPLDTLNLYNNGEWIIFESTKAAGDPEELSAWVDQIGSLLQLLPATAAPQSLETPSGLILPSDERNDSFNDNRGGVGICCTTREAIFRVDALLEQVLSSVSTTESAESGILLLTDEDVTISITSALVIPFDLNLWRAVLELRQDTSR